jgi:hypothetical protein
MMPVRVRAYSCANETTYVKSDLVLRTPLLGLTTYANAFTNLGATGNLYLRNNNGVRTMGTGTSMGFRNLKMVFGTLTFTYHTVGSHMTFAVFFLTPV